MQWLVVDARRNVRLYSRIKDRKSTLKGSRPSVPHGTNFLQVVLVDEIPLSSCTVYRYICGIFLDDISTREQFVFLVDCYRVKAVFHNLCTVVYWRLCEEEEEDFA